MGYVAEHQDTLQKLLGLSLLEQIPAIQAGLIPIAPGVFEHIHANRMRARPRVVPNGLPVQYKVALLRNDEISTRMSTVDAETGEVVGHPVPFSFEGGFFNQTKLPQLWRVLRLGRIEVRFL